VLGPLPTGWLCCIARTPLQGADPTARDGESRTPLHHAVMRGHLAVVNVLLDRGGPALLLAKDILGCTPVHLAAVQNQVGGEQEAAGVGSCGRGGAALSAASAGRRLQANLSNLKWCTCSAYKLSIYLSSFHQFASVLLPSCQVTLIIRLVEALLADEGGRTPLHEVARRRCMQVGSCPVWLRCVAVAALCGSTVVRRCFVAL